MLMGNKVIWNWKAELTPEEYEEWCDLAKRRAIGEEGLKPRMDTLRHRGKSRARYAGGGRYPRKNPIV